MYKHILLPTDGSKLSGKAVTEAVKLAATCGAKITLLHVVSDYRKAMSETYAVPAAMAAPIQKKFQDEAAARSRKIIDTAGAVAKTPRPAGIPARQRNQQGVVPHQDSGAGSALRRWCVQAIRVAPQPCVQHRPSAQFPCGCSGRIHPAYWRRVRRPGWRGWR